MLKYILNKYIHIFVSGLTRFKVEPNFHIRKNLLVKNIFCPWSLLIFWISKIFTENDRNNPVLASENVCQTLFHMIYENWIKGRDKQASNKV